MTMTATKPARPAPRRAPSAKAARSTAARGTREPLSETTLAAMSHYGPPVAAILGLLFWPAGMMVLGIPLIIRLTAGRKSELVRRNSAAAVNFVVTCLLVIGLALAAASLIGFSFFWLVPLGLGFAIFQVIHLTKAGSAAARGRVYHYPLSLRLID